MNIIFEKTSREISIVYKDEINYAFSNIIQNAIQHSKKTVSITISSNLTVSGGSVCANGVECAIRIEDSDGTLLNSC